MLRDLLIGLVPILALAALIENDKDDHVRLLIGLVAREHGYMMSKSGRQLGFVGNLRRRCPKKREYVVL